MPLTALKNKVVHPIPFGDARLKIPVSIVKGARNNNILEHKQLRDVLNEIVDKTNHSLVSLSNKITHARAHDLNQYQSLKQKECQGLIMGTYNTRNDDACELYVPLIGFDIDAIESEIITEYILEDCKSCPYVFLAFPSPSKTGLRIFIWCDASP